MRLSSSSTTSRVPTRLEPQQRSLLSPSLPTSPFRCTSSVGDYDALIPLGTDPGVYSIRVGLFEDDSVFGCSEPFDIWVDWGNDDDGL